MWQKICRSGCRPSACPRQPDRHLEEALLRSLTGTTIALFLTGIEPGGVALLDMTLRGRMKLSTRVIVLYADHESFTLMTPQGHMFAGWITFSALEVEGETVAQAQVLMRASDPIFELG